mgnify:FL=1
MNEKLRNNDIALASLRLAIIQPAFNGTYPDMSKQDYYARIAEKPLKLPDGREVRYSPGTYSCWESAYRKGGFDALIPKERSDKGHCRRLDADTISKIYELRERFPRLTASGIRSKMIADGLINASDASVSTFQRFIRKNNLKGDSPAGIRDRKAFEEEFATGMYQADTLYGPFIKENGVSRRAYCIMILDDKSRLIVGGKFFYQDNAMNFQRVFRDAVATYGIPGKLYVDNGSPYKNEQLPLICGQLGTVLIHTPLRDGASKGKVERNFRTLRQRFLNTLDASSLKDIGQLNRMLADYIRKHNTSVHSATGMPPYSRYMEDLSHIRMPKSSEWLEECFLHRVKRKVRNDATVMLDKKFFDVPMEFIGSSVEIRYRPGELHSAFILQNDKRFPLMPTDKTANSKVKRSNPYNVRYGGDIL